MKNLFIALLLGILIGGGGLWYAQQHRQVSVLKQAREALADATADTRRVVNAKLEALELRPQDIQDELKHGGRIVRRKAREVGQAAADTAKDTRITAEIKAKYVADSTVSATAISVNTTNGRVTLSGTARSPEEIGHAMLLALETDGVREVVSTLQLKGSNGQ